MVLLSINCKPYSCKIFECEISSIIDTDPKKISYKSEPLVNIKNIRQCCRIKKPKDLNGSNVEESIIFSAKKQKPISIPQSSDNDIDEDFVDKLSYNKSGLENNVNLSMCKNMKKFSDIYQEKDDEKKVSVFYFSQSKKC